MKRMIFAIVILTMLTSLSWAQSALFKMRNGNQVTVNGQELIQSSTLMCEQYTRVKAHFLAIGQQRDNPTTYDTPAIQWGVLDPTTNSISATHTQAMYEELNSLVGNAGPALEQWCSKVKQ